MALMQANLNNKIPIYSILPKQKPYKAKPFVGLQSTQNCSCSKERRARSLDRAFSPQTERAHISGSSIMNVHLHFAFLVG